MTATITSLLRRAIEFIEANAAEGIGLGDIAETVCLTPRAVQYMFRRHLDTTPLQHLRRIRLHDAHHELLAADRSTTPSPRSPPAGDSRTPVASQSSIAKPTAEAHTSRCGADTRKRQGHAEDAESS